MPVITDDLMNREYAPTSAGASPLVHEGRSERFGGSARQVATPPSVPRCSGTSLQNFRRLTSLLARQAPQEHFGLCGPSSTHLTGNNHEARSSIVAVEFWVRQFLPSAGC